jgi:predicted translation initiation factor SUI1
VVLALGKAQIDAMFRRQEVHVVDDSEFLPLAELATQLKTRLGTGGTVKDGRIEIQGDHRDRIVAELEGMGYRAKRAGE